jgi:hypothetical protein
MNTDGTGVGTAVVGYDFLANRVRRLELISIQQPDGTVLIYSGGSIAAVERVHLK